MSIIFSNCGNRRDRRERQNLKQNSPKIEPPDDSNDTSHDISFNVPIKRYDMNDKNDGSSSTPDENEKPKTSKNRRENVQKAASKKPLGGDFIKNTLAEMRRTISSDDFKPTRKFNLTERSSSFEPKSIPQLEKKYEKKIPEAVKEEKAAPPIPPKKKEVVPKTSAEKLKDEQDFAKKLQARMKASEPDSNEVTNFKPREDYNNEQKLKKNHPLTEKPPVVEVKRSSGSSRSENRRLSVGDVKPMKHDRPETRVIKVEKAGPDLSDRSETHDVSQRSSKSERSEKSKVEKIERNRAKQTLEEKTTTAVPAKNVPQKKEAPSPPEKPLPQRPVSIIGAFKVYILKNY